LNKNGKFTKSEYLFNRELSWIDFNSRVLEEAKDKSNPLLERVKFLSIFSTNLDEFYMIRVSGLKRQITGGVDELTSDGMNAFEQRKDIYIKLCPLLKEQYRIFNEEIIPELAENNIRFINYEELTEAERERIDDYFDKELFPVLTPIAIDNVHPFPVLANRTIALAIVLDDPDTEIVEEKICVLQVPGNFERFYEINGREGNNYILLEEIIKANVGKLFPGMHSTGVYNFRVTRNADIEIEEEEADDLLTLIEEEVKKRRLGIAVRLEVGSCMPEKVLNFLSEDLELDKTEIFEVDGPLNLGDFMTLSKIEAKNLKYDPFTPRITSFLRDEEDFFRTIRRRDVFLHHPYYSFSSVSEFIDQASVDPKVQAIKMTLYRTSGDSPIIQSLIDAAGNNKQVTAIVELKARFDEENNILWARKLENAGVHVVYGVSGLKTHCKMALVVRKEQDGTKRYLHLSTGNYNPATAKLYTDFGLFTSNEDFCADATNLFNYLTGFSKYGNYKKFLVAPLGLRKSVIKLIEKEIESHKEYGNGHIIIKMNSLVDEEAISKLYEASISGVKCDLIIRGICRLKPGIPGLSENIKVRSIVGRFLEHSRAMYFYNNGNPVIYSGSADIMQRNFDRRVEIMYPIIDPEIKEDIKEILDIYLSDNVKARELLSSGEYIRREINQGEEVINAQEVFIRKVKRKYRLELKKSLQKKFKKMKKQRI